MRKNFLKDISASTIQVVLNQALGLLVFIIISRYLQKSVYGELNWSLAILTFIFTTLSLRLEQIVVRKVAAGDDPSKGMAYNEKADQDSWEEMKKFFSEIF